MNGRPLQYNAYENFLHNQDKGIREKLSFRVKQVYAIPKGATDKLLTIVIGPKVD